MASEVAGDNLNYASEDANQSSNTSPDEILNRVSGLDTPIQPPDPRICTDCSLLPLRQALEKYSSHSPLLATVAVSPVGHRYQKLSKTDCPLCSMLLTFRSGNNKVFGAGTNGEEIVAHGFVGQSEFADYDAVPTTMTFESLCLHLRPLGMHDLTTFRLTQRERLESGESAVIVHDGKHPDIFVPKAVPVFFSADKVESWLSYCKKNHTALCGKINSPVPGLRVIDCATLSVREADDNCDYLALSYVWGTSTRGDDKVRHIDGMVLLPERLSSVISDAITVTRSLGFQYLWVDKFCIDQENSAAKHDQIQQMRSVYENAELTLIAAAGTDGSYGLPGVGCRSRTVQPIARLQGVSVISTMRDPHMVIRSSHWATRGWTYQEAVLSRRRLVFTDEQLYFECNAMNCWESVHSHLDWLHTNDKSRSHDWIRSGMFGRRAKENFGKLLIDQLPLGEVMVRYWSCIEDYSSRDLTFDSDSLQAFQGIIERFSRIKRSVLAIWGLPFPGQAVAQKKIEYFAIGLAWFHSRRCWEDSKRPRRRYGFPSWSWAGWAGEVQLSKSHTYNLSTSTLHSGIKTIAFEDKNNKTTKLLEVLYIDALRKHDFSVLRLHAKPLPLTWFEYRPRKPRQHEMPWEFVGKVARLYLSQDQVTEVQFAQEFKSDILRWRCIWICSVWIEGSFALLLESCPEADTWVRVGIFKILCDEDEMEGYTEGVDAELFKIE